MLRPNVGNKAMVSSLVRPKNAISWSRKTNMARFRLIDGKAGQFVSNFDGKRASCHPLKIARCSFNAADHVHRSTTHCQCKQ